jgi:hypothetical protein
MADMLEIGIRPTLLRAVSLVLYFSVIAMFSFAAIVLPTARRLCPACRSRLTRDVSGRNRFAPHLLGHVHLRDWLDLRAFLQSREPRAARAGRLTRP